MEEIKIKPKNGVVILDPVSYQKLRKSGEKKPKNAYWLRRVADGDVIVINKGDKK